MGTKRKLPFGYKMESGRIAVDATESHWVSHLFSRYNVGVSIQELANFMNDTAVRYDPNKPWNKNMVIQNNHPGIVSRETYQAVQAELARRSAGRSPSRKNAPTGRSCYTSKYALSERVFCGECGTRYQRCSWHRKNGVKVVWRCVSRVEYGSRYCRQSPTMYEEPLQQAIMAAINSVMDPKETICRQITEAAVEETGLLPDSTATLGEINRRLEELEAEFNVLLQQPDSAAKNAERFGSIANEMASLKEQREKISARLRKDQAVQSHVHMMEAALDGMSHHMQQWDEEMIRQLVHTVKVTSADHIKVFLYDGTEIDQTVGRGNSIID